MQVDIFLLVKLFQTGLQFRILSISVTESTEQRDRDSSVEWLGGADGHSSSWSSAFSRSGLQRATMVALESIAYRQRLNGTPAHNCIAFVYLQPLQSRNSSLLLTLTTRSYCSLGSRVPGPLSRKMQWLDRTLVHAASMVERRPARMMTTDDR